MRRWIIEKLGGYATLEAALETVSASAVVTQLGGFMSVEDAIEGIRELPVVERHKVLTYAVKRLFKTIGPDDILRVYRFKHGAEKWLWKGKPMTDAQVRLVKVEARQFKEGFLHEVLTSELYYQANKKLLIDSQEVIDIVAAKLLLYTVDIVETRLNDIALDTTNEPG